MGAFCGARNAPAGGGCKAARAGLCSPFPLTAPAAAAGRGSTTHACQYYTTHALAWAHAGAPGGRAARRRPACRRRRRRRVRRPFFPAARCRRGGRRRGGRRRGGRRAHAPPHSPRRARSWLWVRGEREREEVHTGDCMQQVARRRLDGRMGRTLPRSRGAPPAPARSLGGLGGGPRASGAVHGAAKPVGEGGIFFFFFFTSDGAGECPRPRVTPTHETPPCAQS